MNPRLDRFLSPAVLADPNQVFRGRVVAGLSLVLLSASLPGAVIAWLAYGDDPRVPMALVPGLGNVFVLWLLARRDSHRPAALLQLALVFLGHLVFCGVDGGLLSPAAAWALGLPVLGALTLGPTAGWVAASVASVEVFGLLLADQAGIVMGRPPSPEWIAVLHAASLAILLAVLGVAATLFESARLAALQEASSALTRLQTVHGELVAAHELTLEAGRTRQDFLARVSHELRTPIQGLLGTSRLLMEHGHGEVAGELASNARDSARGLRALVDDLLDVGRLEASQFRLRQVAFDPREALEEAAGLASDTAHRKGLELLSYVGPDVPTQCFGDPDRLRQVILNLLGNAVRYTDRGDIVVRASRVDREAGPALRVEVADSGVGIDLKKTPRTTLLRPFEQLEPFSTRSAGGAGLGLSIAAQIVGLMNGTLDVESEPGVGSTFWFELPLVEPSAPPQVDERLSGLQGLVLGRHARSRSILATLLRDWGINARALPADQHTAERLASGELDADLVVIDTHPDDPPAFALPAVPGLGTLESAPLVVCGPPELLAGLEGRFVPVLAPVRQERLRQALLAVVPKTSGAAPSIESIRASGEHRLAAIPRGQGSVLVVEDDPVNALISQRFLERLGYTVALAPDGIAGLEASESTPFDVILMDCQLPGLTGYQVTEQVRAGQGPNRATPILAVTAHAQAGERERCLEAGMNDCLVKPYEPEELGHLVHALLSGAAR